VPKSRKIPQTKIGNGMKRTKLIQILNQMGVVLVRHGNKHDVYKQPITKIESAVPRHDEIKEYTARSIIKTLSPIINEHSKILN